MLYSFGRMQFKCSSQYFKTKRNHKTNDINRCHNTSYLVQFHNAGAKKESVPGNNYFSKIEKFITEHYEEGENYREFLKFSCREKVEARIVLFVKNGLDHS